MKIFGLALLFCVGTLVARHHRDWQTGRLEDMKIQSYVTYSSLTGGTFQGRVSPDYGVGSTVSGKIRARTITIPEVVTDKQVTISSDVYVFTANTAERQSMRPCRLIVGDQVTYAQEKSRLYVVDADGKECQLDLLRQERRTKSSPTAEAANSPAP